jgi:putative tricarboxylic transport membrane protein
MEGGKHNTDRIAATLVFVFSAVFMWQLKYVHNRLDVIFPRTILIGMIVLSLVLFVKSFVKPDPQSIKDIFEIQNRGRVLTGAFGTISWLLIIPLLGFGVTSVIALIALSIVLGTKSDRTAAKLISTVVVASAVVSVIYYFFSTFMEVQLPKGILF